MSDDWFLLLQVRRFSEMFETLAWPDVAKVVSGTPIEQIKKLCSFLSKLWHMDGLTFPCASWTAVICPSFAEAMARSETCVELFGNVTGANCGSFLLYAKDGNVTNETH